ncbi:MAG TPA: hypothetical protein VG245_00740 [Candidatus Dormibacteraeota bacterium]|nr:hypothetical protein [Candidatus Dormibacteraeota bacterium]
MRPPRWVWYVAGLLGLLLVAAVVQVVIAPGQPPSPTATPGMTISPTSGPGVGDTAGGGQGQDVDGIQCQSHEQVAYHVHAHLFIILDGKFQTVSALIGIPLDPTGQPRCFYWLHTHDQSGIIHIESPDQRLYTLGQFFDVWGQPLSRNGVATYPVPNGDLTAYVDGQPYTGDPREIVLKAHTQVVLELGATSPPPEFVFPAGL